MAGALTDPGRGGAPAATREPRAAAPVLAGRQRRGRGEGGGGEAAPRTVAVAARGGWACTSGKRADPPPGRGEGGRAHEGDGRTDRPEVPSSESRGRRIHRRRASSLAASTWRWWSGSRWTALSARGRGQSKSAREASRCSCGTVRRGEGGAGSQGDRRGDGRSLAGAPATRTSPSRTPTQRARRLRTRGTDRHVDVGGGLDDLPGSRLPGGRPSQNIVPLALAEREERLAGVPCHVGGGRPTRRPRRTAASRTSSCTAKVTCLSSNPHPRWCRACQTRWPPPDHRWATG